MDSLDRIEAWAKNDGFAPGAWDRSVGFSYDSVLALVAVARAARAVTAYPVGMLDKEWAALREALARLDGAR